MCSTVLEGALASRGSTPARRSAWWGRSRHTTKKRASGLVWAVPVVAIVTTGARARLWLVSAAGSPAVTYTTMRAKSLLLVVASACGLPRLGRGGLGGLRPAT